MDRNLFIKYLVRKKYLFTDNGDNIIIHGVDPSKRLNSIQTYGEIDLSLLSSLPRGVIFEDTVDVIRIPKIRIQDIISETFHTIRKTSPQQPVYSDLSHIRDKYVNKLISDLNHTISNYLKEDIKSIKYKNSDDLKFIYENMLNHYFIKTLNMKEKFAKGYMIEESLTEKVIHNVFYQLNKAYTGENNSNNLSLQSLLLKMENMNTKKN
jgi:hypothetical protein